MESLGGFPSPNRDGVHRLIDWIGLEGTTEDRPVLTRTPRVRNIFPQMFINPPVASLDCDV